MRASGAYRGLVLAFEFLVLTAGRSGEVRAARWDEIDRDVAVWTIPGERMKAGRKHRVPLAPQALAVLDQAGELAASSGLIFPSATGRMLSQSGMPKLLHQLGIDAVPHGFRSSFRDWAAECTDAPREVCELALAHVNRDRVEAAYRRSDLFERRRGLMVDWGRLRRANRPKGIGGKRAGHRVWRCQYGETPRPSPATGIVDDRHPGHQSAITNRRAAGDTTSRHFSHRCVALGKGSLTPCIDSSRRSVIRSRLAPHLTARSTRTIRCRIFGRTA